MKSYKKKYTSTKVSGKTYPASKKKYTAKKKNKGEG